MDYLNNQKRVHELLNNLPGLTQSLQLVFNYHYDAILTEIETRINNTKGLASGKYDEDLDLLMDFITCHMEEDMNWPALTNEDGTPGGITQFIKDISKFEE